jgi:hypothetical protein
MSNWQIAISPEHFGNGQLGWLLPSMTLICEAALAVLIANCYLLIALMAECCAD